MPGYELYRHAGEVPLLDWKERGIEVPVLDKDGTLAHCNTLELVSEVVEGLRAQSIADIYPDIAVASNNHDADDVQLFGEMLGSELGVNVFTVCRVEQASKRKPNPRMGLIVASNFGVEPCQLGVIGDRRLTDVGFGLRLGAGAIALCDKAGEGDAKYVSAWRKVERVIVAFDRAIGRAWQPSFSEDLLPEAG